MAREVERKALAFVVGSDSGHGESGAMGNIALERALKLGRCSMTAAMLLVACNNEEPQMNSGGIMNQQGGGAGGLGGSSLAGGAPAPGVGAMPPPIGSVAPPAAAGMGGVGTPPIAAGSGGMAVNAGMGGSAVAGMSGSQDAGVTDAGDPPGGSGAQTLPPVTDYTKAGPFATTMEANKGPGNGYTIFRPEPLGADGFLHAPIIFGPGILTTASSYRTLLNHLASHGFVTICVNSMSGGPGAAANLTAMRNGLDWLIEQNTAAGVYQGKLAVDRATTMGYSIGATASVQLSSHEAIMTSVVIHGHSTMGDPHGPVLMITGTMDVIDDMRRTLTTLEEAPAVLVALPIGHLNVLTEISATGRYIAPITAWLRYWVNGDQDAKRYFWGDGCEMCKSPWIPPEPNAKWKAQTL
jgi:hypothetical protein